MKTESRERGREKAERWRGRGRERNGRRQRGRGRRVRGIRGYTMRWRWQGGVENGKREGREKADSGYKKSMEGQQRVGREREWREQIGVERV